MRETHKKLQPNVDIRAGTAYELPVEDSSFDAVICAQVNLPGPSQPLLTIVVSLVCQCKGIERVCEGSQARGFTRIYLEFLRH